MGADITDTSLVNGSAAANQTIDAGNLSIGAAKLNGSMIMPAEKAAANQTIDAGNLSIGAAKLNGSMIMPAKKAAANQTIDAGNLSIGAAKLIKSTGKTKIGAKSTLSANDSSA